MNSIYNKVILGSVIAFFAYEASVFSQNQGVVFPKINGSTSEMDSSEVLEVAGGVKILDLRGKGERNVVVGPDGRLRERPITTKPVTPGGGGLWKPDGKDSLTTDRNVTINGDISADTASFNQLIITRIVSPDSLIFFGNSSLIFNQNVNRIGWTTAQKIIKGIGIGNGFTFSAGLNAIAIGFNVANGLNAENSIVMGSGPGAQVLGNNIPNSLMIGFNSDIPTLFVGPSAGAGTTGNVGIGTTTPTAKLTILSPSVSPPNVEMMLRTEVSDATGDFFEIANATGVPGKYIPVLRGHHETDNRQALFLLGEILPANDDSTRPVITFDARRVGGPIQTRPLFSWASFGNTKMIMLESGQLQIGSKKITSGTHTNAKLFVDGKIVSKSAFVTIQNWSDYVLDDNYQLPSLLNEVEPYIKVNNHLIGVPSEKEILKNGVNLGEMDAIQIAKIEELTLYTIEQQKQIDELKKEVELLKKHMGLQGNK